MAHSLCAISRVVRYRGDSEASPERFPAHPDGTNCHQRRTERSPATSIWLSAICPILYPRWASRGFVDGKPIVKKIVSDYAHATHTHPERARSGGLTHALCRMIFCGGAPSNSDEWRKEGKRYNRYACRIWRLKYRDAHKIDSSPLKLNNRSKWAHYGMKCKRDHYCWRNSELSEMSSSKCREYRKPSGLHKGSFEGDIICNIRVYNKWNFDRLETKIGSTETSKIWIRSHYLFITWPLLFGCLFCNLCNK